MRDKRAEIVEHGKEAVENAIEQWVIGRNGERDRMILRMHLLDGPTIEEMQKRMDKMNPPQRLSVDRIKKIIIQRTEQIAKHI